jgi:hypothetical protein
VVVRPGGYWLNVLVLDLLEQAMYGYLVLFPAFFTKPASTACAIVIIIIDCEFQYGAHAGEAVKHYRYESQSRKPDTESIG